MAERQKTPILPILSLAWGRFQELLLNAENLTSVTWETFAFVARFNRISGLAIGLRMSIYQRQLVNSLSAGHEPQEYHESLLLGYNPTSLRVRDGTFYYFS